MKDQRNDMEVQEPRKFSKKDRAILLALEPVVDGVATMFGGGCEVVLHSLEDLEHSLVKIANGHVTGRKEGASLTDHAVEMLKNASSSKNGRIETYYTKTSDGTLMRSVIVLIRNEEGKRSPKYIRLNGWHDLRWSQDKLCVESSNGN
jgi:predicted transcriptional regulator YheO